MHLHGHPVHPRCSLLAVYAPHVAPVNDSPSMEHCSSGWHIHKHKQARIIEDRSNLCTFHSRALETLAPLVLDLLRLSQGCLMMHHWSCYIDGVPRWDSNIQ